jgi:hypothetical protein
MFATGTLDHLIHQVVIRGCESFLFDDKLLKEKEGG